MTQEVLKRAEPSIEAPRPSGMLTLDVEDWQHANFAQLAAHPDKARNPLPSVSYAMDRNIDRWIEILNHHDASSTCFVLGEFARKYPASVKKLEDHGHEIACHGLTHDLVYEMSRDRFREWLKEAAGVLGDITGHAPIGFRAPSWSVDPVRTPWFCEELERAGFQYDSSEFPIQTPLYGNAQAKTRPYRVGGLLRIPVTVLELGRARIPFSSGAFFRMAPLPLIRFGFRRAIRRGTPAMAVLHPRELDPDHPRLPLQGWEAWVHYGRLSTTIPKLEAILQLSTSLGPMRWNSIQKQIEKGLLR